MILVRPARALILAFVATACGKLAAEDRPLETQARTDDARRTQSPSPSAESESGTATAPASEDKSTPAPPPSVVTGPFRGNIEVVSSSIQKYTATSFRSGKRPNIPAVQSGCGISSVEFMPGGSAPIGVNAGTITASAAERAAVIDTSNGFGLTHFSGADDLHTAGSIQLHGEGGTTPDFDLVLPTVPAPRVTSPEAGAIDPHSALTVTWEKDPNIPKVVVILDSNDHTAQCTAPGDAGMVIFPASTIAVLANDTAHCVVGTCLVLTARGESQVTTQIGDLSLVALYSAIAADRALTVP